MLSRAEVGMKVRLELEERKDSQQLCRKCNWEMMEEDELRPETKKGPNDVCVGGQGEASIRNSFF